MKTIFNSGLYKEISHLLILNSTLNVLVTYPDESEKTELEFLHRIVSGSRSAARLAKDENLLIILGTEMPYSWRGLVFKEEAWKEISF